MSQKKLVIINGRFLGRSVTGVERNALELVRGLDRLAAPGEIVLALPPDVSREQVPRFRNIRVVRVGRLKDRRLKNLLWEHISFPLFVKRTGGISLNLCNTAPLPSPGIVCICDMKMRAHPEFFSRKFRLWYRLLMWNETRRAKHILTISEYSKREIMKYYRVKPSRITVIPCAWQHMKRSPETEDALQKYDLDDGEFFFAMSSLEPNKNIGWIRRAAANDPEHVFVVAGKTNPEIFEDPVEKGSESRHINRSGNSLRDRDHMPSNIRLIGYIPDAEAKALMRHSLAFLYPSFYEGFGMPPLEALSVGAPCVVVSDIEVMHEVFEEAAIYIDPLGNGEELKCLSDNAAGTGREAMEVLRKYAWKRSAKRLYDLLQKEIDPARLGVENGSKTDKHR